MAMLAALDLVSLYSAPVVVYTFGEPRVGNPALVKWATEVMPQGRQFRVTHKDDPVPRLPPLELGFLHVPHELWYDNDGNTTWTDCTDSATSEDLACSAGRLPYVWKDHDLYLGHHTSCEDYSTHH
jgi:hypothetical protein